MTPTRPRTGPSAAASNVRPGLFCAPAGPDLSSAALRRSTPMIEVRLPTTGGRPRHIDEKRSWPGVRSDPSSGRTELEVALVSGSSALRSRRVGTLATPGGTDCTAGVGASRSTIQQELARPRRPPGAELRHLPRPLPAEPGRLEVHRPGLRGQVPRHRSAGGLGAPPRRGPLTRRPGTRLRRQVSHSYRTGGGLCRVMRLLHFGAASGRVGARTGYHLIPGTPSGLAGRPDRLMIPRGGIRADADQLCLWAVAREINRAFARCSWPGGLAEWAGPALLTCGGS